MSKLKSVIMAEDGKRWEKSLNSNEENRLKTHCREITKVIDKSNLLI